MLHQLLFWIEEENFIVPAQEQHIFVDAILFQLIVTLASRFLNIKH